MNDAKVSDAWFQMLGDTAPGTAPYWSMRHKYTLEYWVQIYRANGAIDVLISDFLLDVATGYNRRDGLASPTQRLLRNASSALGEHIPGGIEIYGSGGKGAPTHTPWVGFFDPDETTTPLEGLYLVYLSAANLESVTLSLMQGITRLSEELGPSSARLRLASDALALRSALGPLALAGLSSTMDLSWHGIRQRAYEAGNVVSLTYEVAMLPPEETLRSDLERFLLLYQDATIASHRLAPEPPGTNATVGLPQENEADGLLRDFRPRSDADYTAYLAGRAMRKSRRHETLIRQFGEWAASQGFACSTLEHPIDLVLRREGQIWLVEGEVMRDRRPAAAMREAVGQLLEYCYFLYPGPPSVNLIALFSEPIGEAFVRYLDSLGISVAHKNGLTRSASGII